MFAGGFKRRMLNFYSGTTDFNMSRDVYPVGKDGRK